MSIYIKNEIIELVNMTDILNIYGFEMDRKNTMVCPFHSEKTGSFKLYQNNKKWKCLGCGVGGNVIDFVIQYFHIDFKQSLFRINNDFNLNLYKNTYSNTELTEIRQKQAQLKEKQKNDKLQAEKENALYWRIWSDWIECDMNFREFAPKNENEELNSLFVESLHKKEYLSYLINENGF